MPEVSQCLDLTITERDENENVKFPNAGPALSLSRNALFLAAWRDTERAKTGWKFSSLIFLIYRARAFNSVKSSVNTRLPEREFLSLR